MNEVPRQAGFIQNIIERRYLMKASIVTRTGQNPVIQDFQKLTFWYSGKLKEFTTDFSEYLDYGNVTLNFIGESQLSINSKDVVFFRVY